ncbi:MAG: hypothetical protein ABIP42_13850, partial [Planctomycetota bacterium]
MLRLTLLVALGTVTEAQLPTLAAIEPNGDSGSPSVSDDGKLVVFESRASNFVEGDEKDTWDVFLFERATGQVRRISDDGNLPARAPRISGDGRWVVYYQTQRARSTPAGSWFSTEVPWKVALVDVQQNLTRWIGDAAPTNEYPDSPAAPSLARDGRRVCFPVMADANPAVRVWNAVGQSPPLIRATKENGAWPQGLREPFLAAGGRFLVFAAAAEDMDVPLPVAERGLDFDDDRHVFRRDLDSGRTEYVSHLALASIGYGDFGSPRVSDNGRYVSYDNYNPAVFLGSTQVGFVSDFEEKQPGRLLRVAAGGDIAEGAASIHWLSSDGRHALVTTGIPSVPAIPAGCEIRQLLIRDLTSSTWRLVSRSTDGIPANHYVSDAAAADDLSVIAFASQATNLVRGDSNHCKDVFLFEPATSRTTRIVPSADVPPRPVAERSTEPNGESKGASISRDGEFVVFASRASNFDESDFGDAWDVFLLTCATRAVQRLSSEPHENVSAPSISGDGRWILWWSQVPDPKRYREDWNLHMLERTTGTRTIVQGLAPALDGIRLEKSPSVTDDGARVMFPFDTYADDGGLTFSGVKLYDRQSGTTSVVSAGWCGAMSADGGHVAVISESVSLASWPKALGHTALPLPKGGNLYVRDFARRETRIASGLAVELGLFEGVNLYNSSFACRDPLLSGDGSRVAFNFECDRYASPLGVLGLVADLAGGDPAPLYPLTSDPRHFRGSIRITWLSPDGKCVLVSSNGEGFLPEPVARFPQ